MSVTIGIFALVLAWALLRWGIGPDWLTVRLAALFALVGATAVVAPTRLGDWARQGAQWVADLVGQLAGTFDASIGTAIAAVFVPVLVLLVAWRWIGAMITGRLAPVAGSFANESYDANLVWFGGVVLGVFAASLPGNLGDLLGGVVGVFNQVGASVVQWAVA